MVTNFILQFDKDSDNSKNWGGAKFKLMSPVVSYGRLMIGAELYWAVSARAELSVSRIDWHLSSKYLCSGLILPARPGYRATDTADVLQARL